MCQIENHLVFRDFVLFLFALCFLFYFFFIFHFFVYLFCLFLNQHNIVNFKIIANIYKTNFHLFPEITLHYLNNIYTIYVMSVFETLSLIYLLFYKFKNNAHSICFFYFIFWWSVKSKLLSLGFFCPIKNLFLISCYELEKQDILILQNSYIVRKLSFIIRLLKSSTKIKDS